MSNNKIESISDHRQPEPELLQIAELLTSLVAKRLRESKPEKPIADEELTVKEVAMLKNVSERTVYGWISSKKVSARKTPGGGIRIFRSEIDKAA